MQWEWNGSRLGYRDHQCSGNGMGHAWVTEIINAVGMEWVTPGLPRSSMQWEWNGSRLGYRDHQCSGNGVGHAWATEDDQNTGTLLRPELSKSCHSYYACNRQSILSRLPLEIGFYFFSLHCKTEREFTNNRMVHCSKMLYQRFNQSIDSILLFNENKDDDNVKFENILTAV